MVVEQTRVHTQSLHYLYKNEVTPILQSLTPTIISQPFAKLNVMIGNLATSVATEILTLKVVSRECPILLRDDLGGNVTCYNAIFRIKVSGITRSVYLWMTWVLLFGHRTFKNIRATLEVFAASLPIVEVSTEETS